MFRRFVPVNTVAAAGAQFAFASYTGTRYSKNKAAKAAGSKAAQGKEPAPEIPLPTFVNKNTIDDEGAYSQSLGFKDAFPLSSNATQFDDLGKTTANAVKEQAQDMDWEGAPSHQAPLNKGFKSNFEIQKEVKSEARSSNNDKSDFKKSNFEIQKDAKFDAKSDSKKQPQQAIKAASRAVSDVKEQAQEMDWEGAALHHAPPNEDVKSNFEIHKEAKSEARSSNNDKSEPKKQSIWRLAETENKSRKSTSSGNVKFDPRAALRSEDNASKPTVPPSIYRSFFASGQYSNEVYAAASAPAKVDVERRVPQKTSAQEHDEKDYNAHNLPPTPTEEVASAVSNMAGRLFHKDSNPRQAGSGAAVMPAPPNAIHTTAEDANPDAKRSKKSSNADEKKQADYSSPDYLIRRI